MATENRTQFGMCRAKDKLSDIITSTLSYMPTYLEVVNISAINGGETRSSYSYHVKGLYIALRYIQTKPINSVSGSPRHNVSGNSHLSAANNTSSFRVYTPRGVGGRDYIDGEFGM